jgi:hypothetical protein
MTATTRPIITTNKAGAREKLADVDDKGLRWRSQSQVRLQVIYVLYFYSDLITIYLQEPMIEDEECNRLPLALATSVVLTMSSNPRSYTIAIHPCSRASPHL